MGSFDNSSVDHTFGSTPETPDALNAAHNVGSIHCSCSKANQLFARMFVKIMRTIVILMVLLCFSFRYVYLSFHSHD
jgi:hypothetical protein